MKQALYVKSKHKAYEEGRILEEKKISFLQGHGGAVQKMHKIYRRFFGNFGGPYAKKKKPSIASSEHGGYKREMYYYN